MSSLWWLEPGWTSATCPHCGVNIHASGGDPDWGECYECKSARHEQEQEQPWPEDSGPPCDICGEHVAVSGAFGYGVCSEACAHEAERRGKETPDE